MYVHNGVTDTSALLNKTKHDRLQREFALVRVWLWRQTTQCMAQLWQITTTCVYHQQNTICVPIAPSFTCSHMLQFNLILRIYFKKRILKFRLNITKPKFRESIWQDVLWFSDYRHRLVGNRMALIIPLTLIKAVAWNVVSITTGLNELHITTGIFGVYVWCVFDVTWKRFPNYSFFARWIHGAKSL